MYFDLSHTRGKKKNLVNGVEPCLAQYFLVQEIKWSYYRVRMIPTAEAFPVKSGQYKAAWTQRGITTLDAWPGLLTKSVLKQSKGPFMVC